MLSKLNLHLEKAGVLPVLSINHSVTAVYRNTAVFRQKRKLTC